MSTSLDKKKLKIIKKISTVESFLIRPQKIMQCNRKIRILSRKNKTEVKERKNDNNEVDKACFFITQLLTRLHDVGSSRTSPNPLLKQQRRGCSVTKVSQIKPVPNFPNKQNNFIIKITQSRAIKRNRVLPSFILYLQFVVLIYIYIFKYLHTSNKSIVQLYTWMRR